MTDKQMPEVIFATDYINSSEKHWVEPGHKNSELCTKYIRADLCEKTIEDKSASHITLETLVEELGEALEAARDQLLEEASCCETLNLTVEYTKKHIDPLNSALSKLDAWRAK